MSIVNQKTLAESEASNRPPMLEKGSYVPWASRFMRFLENKQEEGELMRNSIDNDLYIRKEITNPNGIPNDIYNSVDACLDAKQMWNIIKRLMQGSDISQQERHSRLMNEFNKFVVAEGDSLHSCVGRAITQHYSTPINNHLHSSSNTRIQAVVQDGRVDIQSKNIVQSIKEYDQNVQRNPRTKSTLGKTNVQFYNCNEKGHYAREYPKPRFHDAKYSREQMLLALKDEAEANLDNEENDFMLDNAYGDNTLEELNAAVIMMAHI
ncbi:hypothetical protein Tco_0648972 [Tanacetum coccineum]